MYKGKQISLVIPAYNEEKLIKPTLENVPSLIDKIYVIDDCSPDKQNGVITRCAKKDKRIKLIKHEHNKGYGESIKSGLKICSKDWILQTDGDNQYDINDFKKFNQLYHKPNNATLVVAGDIDIE